MEGEGKHDGSGENYNKFKWRFARKLITLKLYHNLRVISLRFKSIIQFMISLYNLFWNLKIMYHVYRYRGITSLPYYVSKTTS